MKGQIGSSISPDGTSRPLRLHHIGFVVGSIDGSAPDFERCLGAHWDRQIFADSHQKVKVAFLTGLKDEPQLELVQPNAEDAPVNKFLNEKGPGLHHLCYEVDDLEETLAEMRSKGALVAKPPKPAVAFAGRRIAWMLTAQKLLVELVESRNSTPDRHDSGGSS